MWLAVLAAAALAGCASDDPGQRTAREPHVAKAPPPPDAGTSAGHGADPARVAVPDQDDSPPAVTIVLATRRGARTLATASQPPGRRHQAEIELGQPALRGTALGEDPDGGVARVRVSISERIECRDPAGRVFERLRRRYFPPPQIERITAAPGSRLPTRRTRSLPLSLVGARCGRDARAVEVHGQLWGEAINGHGLEAVTPHIRFSYGAAD